MRIYICDDEPQILKKIGEQVRASVQECEISELNNSTELLSLLEEEDCEVLLLDIDLPDMTGLEVAECLNELKRKPLLVFVTSHDELVYDSLQFHPFGFIRKDFLAAELPKILADCEKELSIRRVHYHFRTVDGEISVPLEHIQYFEAEGNYLKVYTGDKCYRFRETMSTVQKELELQGFVRVHRGFLVNQSVVELLGTDELKLINGSTIPIGRNYAETAKKQIMRYVLR